MERKKVYKKITAEELRDIDDVFNVIEPAYWTIDIYETHEHYLKTAQTFTQEMRYLNAVFWYMAEVRNGGHSQFLFNSTGIVWEDALNGFKLFGLPEHAQNLQKVVDFFEGKIPFDREKRQELLDELEGCGDEDDEYDEDEEEENAFCETCDACDDFLYANDPEEVLLDFVKQNVEKFVFEGYFLAF